VVTASGDSENIGHAGWWSLFLFFPSVDALCGDDEGDGDENVLCWLSSRPCLCFFFCFWQWRSAFFFLSFLSFLFLPGFPSLFFLSFFSRFSLFSPFFFCFFFFFFRSAPEASI
jgi:hypothetical protein